ncbi:MAG: hypothetical protein K6G64_03055 [Eubacterium sp.]|jgi:hypothetical protein|nr:hypothetical protein [Eubacterium sp.]
MYKKKKIFKIIVTSIILIGVFIMLIFQPIPIKEITVFKSHFKNPEKGNGFYTFNKKTLLQWAKDADMFDTENLEKDMEGIDDEQRLIVSFGREISFFYRIRPFKPVEVKYKNEEATNYVYVYLINYDGKIVDYSVD